MSEMTVDEAQRLAALKLQIPESDRSLHEQALVTLSAAYDAREEMINAAGECVKLRRRGYTERYDGPNATKLCEAYGRLDDAYEVYRMTSTTPLERNA